MCYGVSSFCLVFLLRRVGCWFLDSLIMVFVSARVLKVISIRVLFFGIGLVGGVKVVRYWIFLVMRMLLILLLNLFLLLIL